MQRLTDDTKSRFTELDVRMKTMADAQRHADERMNALIAVVDGMVRRNPPQP